MVKVWKIKGWDGNSVVFEREMLGNLSEKEISATLQRLVARNLSNDEVIDASRRKNDPNYSALFERIGSGYPISYGLDPHYTAELAEK